ncbi:hypothetical protein DRE_04614 [Drechslerella stenobrocha 248]|uniref:Uncharacterized protein n=1 Tax=Drechslerella stenobrocha 248 TaxID=1043628 RepID=W7IAH0_9PEZI|nr:hypothetical protein DRE_04614 [Drechslerella stenobrocha 248]
MRLLQLPALLAFAKLSTAYLLIFELKRAELISFLSPSKHSIELDTILDPPNKPAPTLQDLEQAEPDEPKIILPEPDVLGTTGIAGRISLPASQSNQLSSKADQAASLVRDLLASESSMQLEPSQIGQPQAQGSPGSIVTVGQSVTPQSVGRCVEFQAPHGETGLTLDKMRFDSFADDDQLPIGISIFPTPGCRKASHFTYFDLDFVTFPPGTDIDLSTLDPPQPISNQFSAMPVYSLPTGGETPLFLDESASQSDRLAQALALDGNVWKSGDTNLLDEHGLSYIEGFDMSWRDDDGLVDSDGEERKAATPPDGRNRGLPRIRFTNYEQEERKQGTPMAGRFTTLSEEEAIWNGDYEYSESDDHPDWDTVSILLNYGPPLNNINTDPQSAGLDPQQRLEGAGKSGNKDVG